MEIKRGRFLKYWQPASMISLAIMGLFLLSSCLQQEDAAPVFELPWSSPVADNQHRVMRGDTLYSIAFHHDMDYRELARLNHLASPYALKIGQVIELNQQAKKSNPSVKRPAFKPTTPSHRVIRQPKAKTLKWRWPAKGKIVARFNPKLGKKGINIAGRKGETIRAAEAGVVAYSGNGLSGYGNLIIIKHNNQYLTAYGNNARNFVTEGQSVKKGEVIASMGVIDRKYWGLHFEVRHNGKPVNPLKYLK